MCVVWQITVQALRWQCALLALKLLDIISAAVFFCFSVSGVYRGWIFSRETQTLSSLATTTNPAKKILGCFQGKLGDDIIPVCLGLSLVHLSDRQTYPEANPRKTFTDIRTRFFFTASADSFQWGAARFSLSGSRLSELPSLFLMLSQASLGTTYCGCLYSCSYWPDMSIFCNIGEKSYRSFLR